MTADSPANAQADSELLSEILHTLKGGEDNERRRAIESDVPRLSDRKTARDELIRLLKFGRGKGAAEEPADPWERYHNAQVRSWAAGALARLCGSGDKKARDAVGDSLEKETEQIPRRWMLSYLHEMGTREDIEAAVRGEADAYRKKNRDSATHRSGLLALVILACWNDREAAQELEALLTGPGDDEDRWEVCKCAKLVGNCRHILEPLESVAQDKTKWDGIRLQAIEAIGRIESPAALRALGRVLQEENGPMLKEAAVEGLQSLSRSRRLWTVTDQLEKSGGTPYSVSDALLRALLDDNAQIRYRAAGALPAAMIDLGAYAEGDQQDYQQAQKQARIAAAEKVVGELVRDTVDPENDVPLLVDALRLIDPPEGEAAASVLRQFLFSEDVSEKQRAEQALKLVGGEKALQTLMNQRSEVLRTYSDLLAKADEPIQQLFEETMHQAQSSFRISQW